MESRPKIVRISSMDFDPLDGVQLRAAYSHLRIGVFCTEPEEKTVCENKPSTEQTRKHKKNLGPVSRLLRRRQQTICLETKSCDNIYVNKNCTSSDGKINQVSESDLQGRNSNSLDWRVGRTANSSDKLNWKDQSRSARNLSKSAPLTTNLSASSAKSKIVSLLKRLSPRLPRSASKVSPPSPTNCPWVQIEFASDPNSDSKKEESQENDISFQREMEINELKKKTIGLSPMKSNPVNNFSLLETY